MCKADCSGLGWKEKVLFWLGIATVVWGSFAFVYSSLLVFVGFAWTRGDVRVANLTVPLVLSALLIVAAGVFSLGPGSGVCCRPPKLNQRKQSLAAALVCRILPFGLLLYVVIYVTVVVNNPDQYPPSPPTMPLPNINAPQQPWPPSLPPAPAWPPTVPLGEGGGPAIDGFFNVAAWLSFAALVVAPIFEVLVLQELNKQDSKPIVPGGGTEL